MASVTSTYFPLIKAHCRAKSNITVQVGWDGDSSHWRHASPIAVGNAAQGEVNIGKERIIYHNSL